MRQVLQTPRKDLSRHKGRRCKGPEAERASGEQGDRAAEVSSKGRTEAKQVREREGQGDRQRTIQTATGGSWHVCLMATRPCCESSMLSCQAHPQKVQREGQPVKRKTGMAARMC